MRIPIFRHWLAAALVAVVGLLQLPSTARADWADASGFLSVSATPRAFDMATKQVFSYVTVTNNAPGAVTGPLRLVIPTSNFTVVGAGTTADGKPYVNLPNGLAQGASARVRVSFTQQRGALTFTTRPERYSPPTVTAGLPGTVPEGTPVTGTALVSGAQGPLSYLWTQTSGPAVVLTGDTTATLGFTAPTTGGTPTTLGFTLAVTDGVGKTTTATASVSVQPNDIVVDAGTDRQVYAGLTVSLHGTGSGPGTSDIFTWTQDSGTAVTLTNAGTANAEFVAPAVTVPTNLVLELTYTDGLTTGTDQVTIAVLPQPTQSSANAPLIVAGATQQQPLVLVAQPGAQVSGGTTETLTAVASGGDGHYTWEWKKPVHTGGAACNTTDGPDDGPQFQVTLPGTGTGQCEAANVTYKVGVIVTDGAGRQAEDVTDLWLNHAALPLTIQAPAAAVSEGPKPATVAATASGGTGPYTYAWVQTGPETSPGVLDPAYIVTLIDPTTTTPSFVPPPVNQDTTLTFRVTITDSTSPTPLSATRDMNVLVRNGFALTPTLPFSLQVPPAVSVIAGTPVKLGAVASGGTPGYTWSWGCTGGTAPTLSGQTTSTLTLTGNAASETLTCTVQATDSAGTPASKQGSVQVNVLATPGPLPLAVPPIPRIYVDEGTAGVTVTAAATGGTGTYSYSWAFVPSGGVNSLTLTGALTNAVRLDAPLVDAQSALNLQVTVTDGASSVTRDAWVVVNDITPPLEIALTGGPLTVTAGQTVHLGSGLTPRGGVGPYVYSWSQTAPATPAVDITDGTTGNPSIVAPTVTASTPFTFAMTVTDSVGHSQTVSETVTVNPAVPNLAVVARLQGMGSAGTELFFNPGQAGSITTSLTAPGTGPYTYKWTQTAGPSLGNLGTGATASFTVPDATSTVAVTVQVSVTDSGGKVASSSVDFNIHGFRPGKPCVVCGDLNKQIACNDMELVIADLTQCPDATPYCMNDIVQNASLDPAVAQYKRCVDEVECDSLWYQATSDEPLCLNFDPANGEDTLICHLCCWGDACNVDTVPPVETLYRP
ncbi:PKD domain-containing protein [Candidatus Thiodictyon syntrophicum]|jgi:hypothetical protein|uniref:Ig-like domain-containing protein n=1 Tax=Candidatus Thiodictyon syntrophicum TaxID=1166950 RepID=A0A2K8UEA8_9GAMM|nr:hypothetical protein [Candidatus Thiodictyon syntrophicum]AUB83928.1 hypothetical protein THSYN_25345 [Candidatus Thiodictyon syntrophicum]